MPSAKEIATCMHVRANTDLFITVSPDIWMIVIGGLLVLLAAASLAHFDTTSDSVLA